MKNDVTFESIMSVGLSCEPADWDQADKAINELYTFLKLKRPEHIFHCDSPLSAQKLYTELTGSKDSISTHGYGYGQSEAFWLIPYKQYLSTKEDKDVDRNVSSLVDILYRLALSSGVHYMFEEAVFICDKHCKISLNDKYELHNEDGPAIEYRDGYAVYAINGVFVPSYIITNPEKITIESIDDPQLNAEVSRIMLERFGISRYLKESGSKVIDIDGGLNVVGAAVRTLIEDKNGNKWLVGSDGSTERVYHMPVSSDVTTCVEAHNSMAGFDESRIIAEA